MKKKEAGDGKVGPLRLDKYLADMGLGSRSQIREAVRKGRIRVDGAVERDAGRKVNPQAESVTCDGREIAYTTLEYYMLNKPQGVVSATEDYLHGTVVDLITDRKRKDLFPVGRLDIDTEGLLLITNDGSLAHELLSPKKHVDKTYYAEVEGQLPEDAAERFWAGIILDDGTETMPAVLQILDGAVHLTIREGKFHQVKRMFEALGCKVTYLKRISMGSLRLDESLKPGQYRPLTEQEIEMLRKAQMGEGKDRRRKGMLEGIKAFIFDLDGTLVDSMWMWKAIDIEYLGRYGYECPDDLQKVIEGMSFSETAVYFKERFQIPDSLDGIKAAWTEMSIDKYRYEVPLKPGAKGFLDYAREHGIACGIATSNGREMVDAVLTSTGITDYFQVVTTACEVKEGKPSPDIYLKVAEDLGVEPDRCLVFEDVPAGILAGKRAGMKVCAVADEFSEHMREEKLALADYDIEDYLELLEKETIVSD